jgi:hypothetical protein
MSPKLEKRCLVSFGQLSPTSVNNVKSLRRNALNPKPRIKEETMIYYEIIKIY